MPLYLIPFQCEICWHPKTSNDVTFQIYGSVHFCMGNFLVHSWISMIFNQNGVEFDFLTNEQFLYGLYRPIFLLTSNDVMFQISHQKSIKWNDILHHFNARLETLWYLSTFIRTRIYWKMSAAQNWVWPRSPQSVPDRNVQHYSFTCMHA